MPLFYCFSHIPVVQYIGVYMWRRTISMKRKISILTILLALALLMGTCVSYADSYHAYSTTRTGQATEQVNVRADAGTGASLLGSLNKGDKKTIYGYKKASDGVNWYRIYIGSKKGYVCSKYIKITSTHSYIMYNTAKKGTVTGDSVNVRKKASASGELLGQYTKGTSITLKGYAKDSSGTKWYAVNYSGSLGFISSNYVTVGTSTSSSSTSTVTDTKYHKYTKTRTVKTKKSINVRSSAGTSGKKITTLAKGKSKTAYGYQRDAKGNKWLRVYVNGKKAYVSAAYVKTTKVHSYYKYRSAKKATVIKSAAIRAKASTSSTKKGTYKAGTAVSLKGYYDVSGVRWYAVKYNGNICFVRGDLVTTGKVSVAKYATAKTDVNVRSGAGTKYSIIGSMSKGTSYEVSGSKKDSSGNLWYKIKFGSATGYVSGSYVSISTRTETTDNSFESQIKAFPASYKPYLRKLHSAHPKWTFKPLNTGLKWSDVVNIETKVGKNLTSSSYVSYRSMEKGAYDWNSGKYVTFDSGGWYSAHSKVIKYYLDPRNFLNDNGILMFLDHRFNSGNQTSSMLNSVVKGTFLAGSFPESSYSTYKSAIFDICKGIGINPNVIASMIIQEQGTSGKSNLISGTYSGYKGYYNYLNIGAYRTSTMSAVQRGLWYAKKMGWNTRVKSIRGGSQYYYDAYVKKNQNTFYTKKFNVANGLSNVGSHQYMGAVQAAYDEAVHLKKGASGILDTSTTFLIPVYSGMPSGVCTLPKTTGNNNNFLKSLSVTNGSKTYKLSTSFNRYTKSYTVTVPSSVKTVSVNAVKSGSGATMTGAGTRSLASGTNTLKVKVKSTSGLTRTYTITVKRN